MAGKRRPEYKNTISCHSSYFVPSMAFVTTPNNAEAAQSDGESFVVDSGLDRDASSLAPSVVEDDLGLPATKYCMCLCDNRLQCLINGLPPVYYRLFSPMEPVPTRQKIHARHTNLSRIDIDLIPPPHTAKHIADVIMHHEQPRTESGTDMSALKPSSPVAVYLDICDVRPTADTTHVDVAAADGPGTSARTPLLLVLSPLLPSSEFPFQIRAGESICISSGLFSHSHS